MAKNSRTSQSEITTTFYGINPKTYEIEVVSLTRGGKLSRLKDGTNLWTATVPVGAAKHEIVVQLGLVEIVETSAQFAGDEQRKKIIQELEEKPRKCDREAASKNGITVTALSP